MSNVSQESHQDVRESSQPVEEHGGELDDDDGKEEEHEDDTDWLQVEVLLGDDNLEK